MDTDTDGPLPYCALVTVCDKCFCACCWQGIFMCDEAKWAGTVEKTAAELRALPPREHESYWFATSRIPDHASLPTTCPSASSPRGGRKK